MTPAQRILDRWHKRIAPFKRVVDELLGVTPAGFAMEDMNSKYAVCNTVLVSTYERDQKGRISVFRKLLVGET